MTTSSASDGPSRLKELLRELGEAHEKEVEVWRSESERLLAGQPPAPGLAKEEMYSKHGSQCSTAHRILGGPLGSQPTPSSITRPSAVLDLKAVWKTEPVNSSRFKDVANIMMSSSTTLMRRTSTFDFPKLELRSWFDINSYTQVILPHGNWRSVCDFCGLVLILYDLLTVPMQAFEPEETWFMAMMDWVTLLFWTFDMIQSFSLAYYHQGELVTDRRRIIINYLRTWFLLDLLVVLPEWILIFIGYKETKDLVGLGRILRLRRAFRIARFARLFKLSNIINAICDIIDSEYSFVLFNLSQLLLTILLLNHCIACGWYLVGSLNMKAGNLSWIEHSGSRPTVHEDLTWRYITSLHWSLTQFTPASMEVHPQNVAERIFAIVVLFFALLAFGTVVGGVTASMTHLRNIKNNQVRQFWLLRCYLRQNQISAQLSDRIRNYLDYKEQAKYRFSHSVVPLESVQILGELSQPLRNELTSETYTPDLKHHSFFHQLKKKMSFVLFEICTTALRCSCFATMDIIFTVGDEGMSMFFVRSGEFQYCKLGDRLVASLQSCDILAQKSWISEMVLWTPWRHQGTLRADKSGELIVVNPGSFADAIKMHPQAWHFARNYARQYLEFLNGLDPLELTDVVAGGDFFDKTLDEKDYQAKSDIVI